MPKTVRKHNQAGEANKKARKLQVKRGKKGPNHTPIPQSKVKSAAELGLQAKSLGITKKPRSKKIQRILEKREP
jgi:hypothetical protein